MDWLNIADMAIQAGKYIFSELNSMKPGSAEQLRLQRLRQAEAEKAKGLHFYNNNKWQDAVYSFESAKRLNPDIKGIDGQLSYAKIRLARRNTIFFLIRLCCIIAAFYGIFYLLIKNG
ncbi:MAG: hypothetical protein J0L60_14805 [Ignavibacteria bacterium]|nr:hypothetical protein [Ignavibacteria bacterium]